MEARIYQSLGGINAEVGAIGKGQTNTQQGFKFRGIDDFMNSLHGLFAKHGVIILPSEREAIQEQVRYISNGYEKIQFRSRIHFFFRFVSTEDGSEVTCDGWGESADNGDKGYNKCKSIALKYALMQMFLVPTADIADPDKETPEEIVTTSTETPKTSPQADVKGAGKGDTLKDALKAVEGAKSKADLDATYMRYGKTLNYNAEFLKALNAKDEALKK